jgi:hypothetical protein
MLLLFAEVSAFFCFLPRFKMLFEHFPFSTHPPYNPVAQMFVAAEALLGRMPCALARESDYRALVRCVYFVLDYWTPTL